MIKERILVLCIDRDDDLGKKTKINGPVIGKDANVAAATALMLKDAEETDGNAIFQAVRVYEDVLREKEAQVATLTGDSKLGYEADRKIARQLERVLAEFPAESCIFVTDGADDEEILPIISSRIKVDSVRTVVMKQAKELEKTYLVLLNKLREPYYARIIFGIPALILLAFLASETLGFGLRPIMAILGIYLLIKGFGIEDNLISLGRSFFMPPSRTAFVVYLPVIALMLISLSIAFAQYTEKIKIGLTVLEAGSFAVKSILTFVPIIIMLMFVGKILTLLQERRKFEMIDSGLYASNLILVAFVGYVASSWVAGEAWFSEFLAAIPITLIAALVLIELARTLKFDVVSKMKLENKEAITEGGTYLGKIVGVDKKNSVLLLQTQLGHKIPVQIDTIVSVGERVVLKR